MPKPLLLMVYVHKDLSEHDSNDLYDTHFKWLSKEFETISGRIFGIIMVPHSRAPELCEHSYKVDTPEQALYSWYEKIERNKEKIIGVNSGYTDHTLKCLLLTRDNLSDTVGGIATHTGSCAIASINGHQTPAHEVGHLFGARHEDYEVYYNGWWDETIMASGTLESNFRGNAKRFSDKNREHIRNYLELHD
ncbi:hypothetical protein [Pseudomonas sp. McL0111]|uniref:hypothetical protein n=1 Tax=Pseudomonas sp. McL0111 TaxID=3457357 RepID=UPI00403E7C58